MVEQSKGQGLCWQSNDGGLSGTYCLFWMGVFIKASTCMIMPVCGRAGFGN